jgi:hypothetical protein
MTSADAGLALRTIGSEAIPFLIKDLGNEEGLGRSRAVLAGMGSDSLGAYPVAQQVGDLLQHAWSSSSTKESAAYILGEVGAYLQSLKVEHFTPPDHWTGLSPAVAGQCAAAEKLIASGLARAASDINSSVRAAAREAMKQAGIPSAPGKAGR